MNGVARCRTPMETGQVDQKLVGPGPNSVEPIPNVAESNSMLVEARDVPNHRQQEFDYCLKLPNNCSKAAPKLLQQPKLDPMSAQVRPLWITLGNSGQNVPPKFDPLWSIWVNCRPTSTFPPCPRGTDLLLYVVSFHLLCTGVNSFRAYFREFLQNAPKTAQIDQTWPDLAESGPSLGCKGNFGALFGELVDNVHLGPCRSMVGPWSVHVRCISGPCSVNSDTCSVHVRSMRGRTSADMGRHGPKRTETNRTWAEHGPNMERN